MALLETLAHHAKSAPKSQRESEANAVPALAVIIPTLREAENIKAILDRVRVALDPLGIPYEIVVVDDDSSDATGEIVTAIGAADPRVRLCVRKGEKGVAGATLLGWQNTKAPILGVIDADLQHPPEVLPKLVTSILEGRDVAVGSRYAAGGSLGHWHPARKLLSVIALSVAQPVQKKGIRAKDPTSGYFVLRRECLEGAQFQKTGFKLLLEILVRGRVRSIAEIPYGFNPRHKGESKATAKVARQYAWLLAKLYWERFGPRRRVHTLAPTPL